MLYLAAFTVVLGRYSGGQEDLLVHTPSANRDRREVEPLIGLFVNPLLLRADLSGDPTFGELLARTRRTVLGAFEHSGASFEKLIEELQPRRLQVDFLYQNNFLQPAQLPGLDLVPLAGLGSASLAEWGAAVVEDGTQTKLSLSYNASLFDVETVDRVLASYRRLLEAIATAEGVCTPISQLSMEPARELPERAVLIANRWRLRPKASVGWTAASRRDPTRGRVNSALLTRASNFIVLGRHLEPSPVGVMGEIFVCGVPDAIRATLPATAWVEHPRLGPLLKTGDFARYRPDGRIEWISRAEQVARVHGLRVDTGEIERALRKHPHVTEAVVLWRTPRDGGERRLSAFFRSDGAPPALVSHSQLRDFLRESLPEELIPGVFVLVERFPLTADGRLDAALLPDPAARSSPYQDEKYDAPYLTIHHQLIEIWRELLNAPRIGIRDDFFALGGNSLLAMRMLYRVEQACGKALLPATLFQEATIEHLADKILRQNDGAASPDVIRICETGAKTPIFYLHGDMTGGGYYCMKLSRRLGPEQPFYALPPLNGAALLDLPSIEAMAAVHLKTVRAVRPHGPYVIGGFCVGGLLAQALAGQLEAQGEKVERLLIIDATARTRRLERFRRLAGRLGQWRGWNLDRQLYHFCRWHFLAARLQRWISLDACEQRAIFQRRLTGLWERLRRREKMPKTGEPAVPPSGEAVGGAWFDPRWDVPLIYLWAVGGFRPRHYAGPTTLLLSRDLIGVGHGHPEREWKQYIPRLETRALVGSHLACITEHADGLAETIQACLEDHAG